MGIIRAFTGAFKSVLKEQWKESFYMDSIPEDILMLRGMKRIGKNSSNTRADDGIITNGSVISVADGQAVIVVAGGKVIETLLMPGEHIFHDPERKGGIKGFFRDVRFRVGFGGGDIQPFTHRLYYVNIREMPGSFSIPASVPVHIKDRVTGLDADINIIIKGGYTFKVTDSARLYRGVTGNVVSSYPAQGLIKHINSLMLMALGPAIEDLTETGMRPSDLPSVIPELREAIRKNLSRMTEDRYGITVVSVNIEALYVPDLPMVQELEKAAVLRDPDMAIAYMTTARADAMKAAAENTLS